MDIGKIRPSQGNLLVWSTICDHRSWVGASNLLKVTDPLPTVYYRLWVHGSFLCTTTDHDLSLPLVTGEFVVDWYNVGNSHRFPVRARSSELEET